MSDQCRNCKFFKEQEIEIVELGKTQGVCRRFPPAIYWDMQMDQTDQSFTTVYDANTLWCGEWRSIHEK